MINREVKGTLARLLATENLTVEHRQVTTAYFEVDKRVLVLPIWKDASSTVYDLLVGHEVGHALYTPNKNIDAPKSFVNILEDVRIERMMKVTYPGLRKSFFDGYRELWDRDFFGVKHTDIDTLPFIDRINLYFKGNNSISFNDEEQVWVCRAATTNSFEEVEELARELYSYAESKEEEKDAPNVPQPELNMGDESQSGDEDEEVQFEPTSSDDDGEEGDSESEEKDPDSMTDEELLDALEGGSPVTNSVNEEEYKETESVTEEAFAQALETLVDDNAKEWKYLTLPEVDVDKVIIKAEEIQDDLYYHFEGYPVSTEEEQIRRQDNLNEVKEDYNKFKSDAKKSVDYLVKQFEMKKSADQYARAATSKTGVIDTNSLFKYKVTDDIFKRITTVKDGKNHGLIMFLDWSGSMQYQLIDTLKQTYNLIWFCRKAGIPFRVYGFQNGWGNTGDTHPAVKEEEGALNFDTSFKLLEFFSSRQNAKSLDKSLQYVYYQASAMCQHYLSYNSTYALGGTPLVDAILCSRYLVDRIKRVENVTKVNVVCLTDGEANPMQYMTEDVDYYGETGFRNRQMYHSSKVFILRDPKTGYTKRISNSHYETTKEIVSFFREITDYNWVGIRLCSKSNLSRIVRSFAYDMFDKIDKQWRKDKYASIKNLAGFSEAFYMPERDMGGSTDELEVKQKGEVATKAELGRAFKKHMSSKMTNKKVLNAFIEQIA